MTVRGTQLVAPLALQALGHAPPAIIIPAPSSKPLFDVGLKLNDALHHATRGQGAKPGAPAVLAGFLARWTFAFPAAVGASVALGTGDVGALMGIFTLPLVLGGLEQADRLYRWLPVKPTAAKALGLEFAEGGTATKALLTRLAESWLQKLDIWKIEAPDLKRKLEQVAATKVSLEPAVAKRVDTVYRLITAIPTNGWSLVLPGSVLRDFNELSAEDRKVFAPILLERFFHKDQPRGFTSADGHVQLLFTALSAASKEGK